MIRIVVFKVVYSGPLFSDSARFIMLPSLRKRLRFRSGSRVIYKQLEQLDPGYRLMGGARRDWNRKIGSWWGKLRSPQDASGLVVLDAFFQFSHMSPYPQSQALGPKP